jgi:hypothetical protein
MKRIRLIHFNKQEKIASTRIVTFHLPQIRNNINKQQTSKNSKQNQRKQTKRNYQIKEQQIQNIIKQIQSRIKQTKRKKTKPRNGKVAKNQTN